MSCFLIWNNEISIADIISVVALFATLITVILIFIQRSDSTKPYVCIKTTSTIQNIKYNNDCLESKIEHDSVQLCCYGNGIAKDVVVESFFILDKELDFYKSISIKGGVATIKDEDGKMKSFFLVNPRKDCWSIIGCDEKTDLIRCIYGKVLCLAFCGLDAVSQSTDLMIPISTPNIIFRISYKDMFDKKYETFFRLSCDISSFSSSSYFFSFNCKAITKKIFMKAIKLHKQQKCCGWFRENYKTNIDYM